MKHLQGEIFSSVPADVNTEEPPHLCQPALIIFLHLPLPSTSFPTSFSNNNQSSVSGGASISVPTIPVSASLPSVSGGHGSSAVSGGFNELRSSNGSRKARVLYDYDAASSSELSLLADEVILTPQLSSHSLLVSIHSGKI